MTVPGNMDVEPLYCAEQINVPPELADVLKSYTKEVVRRQPHDLYEFSAKYFAELAEVARTAVVDIVPPTVDQIKAAFEGAAGVGTLSDLKAKCVGAGVMGSTVDQAFQLGEFEESIADPKTPLVMLLTMTDATFVGIVASLFDVFGTVKEGEDDPSLRAGSFLETFITLTEKDPSMTADRLNELKEQLPKAEGEDAKDEDVTITFADVMKTEAFQAILEASE
jgi:hypothetical protein